MSYRISLHKRYDEKCELQREWYTVEELVQGWFGQPKWKTFQGSGYGGDTDTSFNNTEEAVKFIEKVKEGTPRNTDTQEVVAL